MRVEKRFPTDGWDRCRRYCRTRVREASGSASNEGTDENIEKSRSPLTSIQGVVSISFQNMLKDVITRFLARNSESVFHSTLYKMSVHWVPGQRGVATLSLLLLFRRIHIRWAVDDLRRSLVLLRITDLSDSFSRWWLTTLDFGHTLSVRRRAVVLGVTSTRVSEVITRPMEILSDWIW